MRNLISKLASLASFPPIGKIAIRYMKSNGLKFLQVPHGKVLEKQEAMLKAKFSKMSGTLIGKKLGLQGSCELTDLPLTGYKFYEPYFNAPSEDAFMYPLHEYVKTRTSGSSGKEKWFLHPRILFTNSYMKTGMSALIILFHDGEKCRLEYKDNVYVNVAPPPFPGGFLLPQIEEMGVIRIVPNINLHYRDKVEFLVYNYESIDGGVLLASTLLTQIMPKIGKPINLKGLLTLDSVIADANVEEIQQFVGISPKSLYGSTETLCSTVPSVEYPLGFIFDWRRGIIELHPVAKGEMSPNSLIGLEEVRPGEVYQPVYTSLEGDLTRYVLDDLIRCVAKSDDVIGSEYPVFKFQTRIGEEIALQNFTRISENEIIAALTNARVPFIDFVARVEIIGHLEYLVLYLEYSSKTPPEDIAKAIHSYLYENDVDYRNLIDFFEYFPIKIRVVPKGVFARFLEDIPAGSVPKVHRIGMKKEDFERLLKIISDYGGFRWTF